MHRIVVSDIFGKTSELEELCNSLKARVEIVDPYSGKFMCFKKELEAYEYFMANVGIQAYAELLLEKLASVSNPTTLIGFSVGASAIWKVSGNHNVDFIKNAICFYGSQIRNHTEVNPCFNIDLIFPTSEPIFSVGELANTLSKKSCVAVHNTPYLHGFMNSLSKNFSHVGYNEYIDWLCEHVS
ncbi:MAG: hypothetical protein KQI81_23300 [Deltaproteobacteria bacterium]|nr:hypothetical protein [Deltaproteobacteria bacterium]